MKSTLWIIIALVTGIVGFLVGYSVSGFTGSRAAAGIAGNAAPAQEASAHPTGAGGYGAAATAHKPEAGGYGAAAAAAPAPKAQAGGYGAVQPAAQTAAPPKPKAAGY